LTGSFHRSNPLGAGRFDSGRGPAGVATDADTMTDDTDDTTETNHNLNESADKIRLKAQIKRGSGTRDQDTHDIKVRGETPEKAAANMSDALVELEARDVFDRAREIGNEEDA
jgi:hypothetical protein